MLKKSLSKNIEVLYFILFILFCILFIYVWLVLNGNSSQVFKDIVVEYTAKVGSNKSAERLLVYILIALSLFGSFLFYNYYNNKIFVDEKTEDAEDLISNENTSKSNVDSFVILLIIPSVITISSILFYGKVDVLSLLIILLVVATRFINKELLVNSVILFISVFYSLIALLMLYFHLGGNSGINQYIICIGSFVLTLIVLVISSVTKKKAYYFTNLFLQVIIPFSLLIFLGNKYLYEGTVKEINVPGILRGIIYGIIGIFVLYNVFKVYKGIKKSDDFVSSISVTSIICILNFNRYFCDGVIIKNDLHHPFEDIIAYSQIVSYKMTPFSEYIPVSGLFSFVQGFFLSVFGKDNFAFYNVTENLFLLTVIILSAVLIAAVVGKENAILFSLLISVVDYNRVSFIIPIMLVLILPKIMEKKGLWLVLWFLTSLFHGLYYPLFGAATCLAFLPMGIYQLNKYVKKGELKTESKKPVFWICIVALLALTIISIPLLIGTAKHTLAMSSQTIYADGLSRFGQKVSDTFIPYIGNNTVRKLIFYIFTFLFPIMPILILGMIAMKMGEIRVVDNKFVINNHVQVFVCLSVIIMCSVSYSYTVVRYDMDSIYARSNGIIISSVVIALYMLIKYMDKSLIKYFLLAASVLLLSVSSLEGYKGVYDSKKFTPIQTVPDSYVYVADNDIKRASDCFMAKEDYDTTKFMDDYINGFGLHNESFIGIGYYGAFYLNGIKGNSVMEIMTIKGRGAAKETIENIKKNKPIVAVSGDQALGSYYLFNWLVTSNQYYWSPDDRMFHPNETNMSEEEIRALNKSVQLSNDATGLSRIAGSFGESYFELEDCFEKKQINYTPVTDGYSLELDFENEIPGEEADFLYLSFKDEYKKDCYFEYDEHSYDYYEPQSFLEKSVLKKGYNEDKNVYVSWTDEQGNESYMYAYFEKGNLIIPLGAGKGWLANNHSSLKIYVVENDSVISLPEVNNIVFLKLRSAEDD